MLKRAPNSADQATRQGTRCVSEGAAGR